MSESFPGSIYDKESRQQRPLNRLAEPGSLLPVVFYDFHNGPWQAPVLCSPVGTSRNEFGFSLGENRYIAGMPRNTLHAIFGSTRAEVIWRCGPGHPVFDFP